jgi:hypothetical protein
VIVLGERHAVLGLETWRCSARRKPAATLARAASVVTSRFLDDKAAHDPAELWWLFGEHHAG